MSAHLAILVRAGLGQGTRNGRAIIYSADIDGNRTFIQAHYHETKKDGWTVISMKNDWNRIFAFET